ncbi:MAG: prolyl oligopeptidase family serine peptidase [Bacteroidota bacterium]
MRKYICIATLLLYVSSFIRAQEVTEYKKASFKSGDFILPYRILYPVDYDTERLYPLVLFPHGAGERGSDNEKQLVHGSKLFLNAENRMKYPAIVVFPQCPKEGFWSNVDIRSGSDGTREFDFSPKGNPTASMQAVLSLLDSLSELTIVDKDRVYVGGLSMGGMGTFEIVRRKPRLFAAAFPICGGGNPRDAKGYARKVPFWVFHGAKDDVVPPELSKNMVEALKTNKGDVKFTLYPEANHNSWDAAFAEPDLLPWIFSNKK